jgi:hypothetical protein
MLTSVRGLAQDYGAVCGDHPVRDDFGVVALRSANSAITPVHLIYTQRGYLYVQAVLVPIAAGIDADRC